jgi:hypothetical protein
MPVWHRRTLPGAHRRAYGRRRVPYPRFHLHTQTSITPGSRTGRGGDCRLRRRRRRPRDIASAELVDRRGCLVPGFGSGFGRIEFNARDGFNSRLEEMPRHRKGALTARRREASHTSSRISHQDGLHLWSSRQLSVWRIEVQRGARQYRGRLPAVHRSATCQREQGLFGRWKQQDGRSTGSWQRRFRSTSRGHARELWDVPVLRRGRARSRRSRSSRRCQ